MSGSALSQTKDPAIKLFGRIVSIPDVQIPDTPPSKNRCSDITNGEIVNLDENDSGELHKSAATAQAIKDNQTPTESNELTNSKLRADQVETSSTEKEKLKKPDKILPCPRCNSLDTKFCYFNNYNVNQPRHFCKSCQRYWTAGGTMRNVPIGAGRRKNKHLASQFRQMLLSSEMPLTGLDNSDSESHELISSAESVTNLQLAASGNEPLCKSVEKALNLGDQTKYADMTSIHTQDNKKEPSSCGSFTAATMSGGSDISESVSHKQPVDIVNSSNVIKVPHGQCYPVPPWLFTGWSGPHSTAEAQSPGGKSCVPNGNNVNQVQWRPAPIIAVPGSCTPSIPLQLVPASYVSCMPVFAAGTMSPDGSYTSPSPSSSMSTSCCSGNGLLKLGKHSRDSNLMEEEQAESCVLVPKTLRMDDLNEASKRPLWAATLNPTLEKKIPIAQGLVFKTFDTKADRKSRVPSPILEANPAALSRANTFQESS